MLGDGAGADKARRRRAVLTIELSKPRLVGEKEGAGDCGHGRAAIARKKRTGSTSQICSLNCLENMEAVVSGVELNQRVVPREALSQLDCHRPIYIQNFAVASSLLWR